MRWLARSLPAKTKELTADPTESIDISSSHPADAERLRDLLRAELANKYESDAGAPERKKQGLVYKARGDFAGPFERDASPGRK